MADHSRWKSCPLECYIGPAASRHSCWCRSLYGGTYMSGPRSEEVEKILSVQRAARRVADSAADWWRRLSDAAETVVTDETLDDLYRQSLVAMKEVLGAEEVSILLANETKDALVARASIGLGEEQTVALSIPSGKGMAGWVLATQEPIVIGDLSNFSLVSPVLREQGLQSVVAVPILSDKKVLGVLHAGSRHLDHFTDSDAELLSFLAERLALALDRVRLFEEQRRLGRVSSFLAETARIMAGASDLTGTLEELAQAALPVLGDLCLIDVIDDEGKLKRIVARHVDPERQDLADRLCTEFPPVANGSHPAAEVLRLGGSRWSPTMSDEFLRSTTHNDEHYALTKALGFRSYLVVPISDGTHAVGALTMVSCSRALTDGDVELAEGLAREVGSVVAKAQQLDLATQTSHELQTALLPPDLPEIPGLTIHTSYVAATTSLDVGGDFYDVVALPKGKAWIMIGDVEGHDRRAAAVMGQLRSAARTLASQGNDPVGVIRGLRECWHWFGFDRLATVLVGHIEPATGMMTIASAGHLPPMLVSDSSARFLPIIPSPPLGVDAERVQLHTSTLRSGEVILLYTDGVLNERTLIVTETMEYLRKVAMSGPIDPRAICRRVIEIEPNRDDDVALLAVSVQRSCEWPS